MSHDVVWPNGMEGGFVYGHEGVRDYRTRQGAQIDPHVEPVAITPEGPDRWVVKVHQVVHDIDGNLLLDTIVFHVYAIEVGRMQRMDIQPE